jgi:hypothetical protein
MRLRRSPLVALLFVAATAWLLAIYLRRPPALPGGVEGEPVLPPAPSAAPWLPDLRPPQPSEVAAALQRALRDGLPPEAGESDQPVMGDFNGDRSPDLMVSVRPHEERLSVINDPMANWIRQDPGIPLFGPAPVSRTSVVVGKDDWLLAVVHGVGAPGWRDPNARQAYLLKVTPGLRIQLRRRETVLAQAARSQLRLPYLRGDLVYDDKGRRLLYWTGARYAWYVTPASLDLTEGAAPGG